MSTALAIGLLIGGGNLGPLTPNVNGGLFLTEAGDNLITENSNQLIAQYTSNSPLLTEAGDTLITENSNTLITET